LPAGRWSPTSPTLVLADRVSGTTAATTSAILARIARVGRRGRVPRGISKGVRVDGAPAASMQATAFVNALTDRSYRVDRGLQLIGDDGAAGDTRATTCDTCGHGLAGDRCSTGKASRVLAETTLTMTFGADGRQRFGRLQIAAPTCCKAAR
jgi:hypothetical protein